MLMNREEIKAVIPHRDPFLLIDGIESMADDTVVACKTVTGDEEFFRGHFPQYPIMPGVLIIEAMAQALAVLMLSRPEHRGKLGFLGGMDKVRFKRQVKPGDQLRLEVTLTKLRGTIGFAKGKAFVDGEMAAGADIICAIGGRYV
jgi:3-hydroxyacyl-[acyl-carrier-protein] dehydratase